MLSSSFSCNTISPIPLIPTLTTTSISKSKSLLTISNPKLCSSLQFGIRRTQFPPILCFCSTPTHNFGDEEKSRVLLDTPRLLEWDKLCDIVASFAQTPLGRDAIKGQLSRIDQTYEESIRLLKETDAVVALKKLDCKIMNFDRVDALLVKSVIDRVRKGIPVEGREAIAVANMLRFAEAWRKKYKVTVTTNNDLHELIKPFKPLDELVRELHTNKALVLSILKVLNEDGSIKDSASPKLRSARKLVVDFDDKLKQLMISVIARSGAPSLNAAKMYGRWCIISGTAQFPSLEGLLVSSGEGMGNIIEPICAMHLNEELELAEAYVAKLEEKFLETITAKMNARASYSISVKGTSPDLFILDGEKAPSASEIFPSKEQFLKLSYPNKKQWKLHLLKANHPLLVQRHQDKLQKARKEVAWSISVGFQRFHRFREKKSEKEDEAMDPRTLQEKVTQLEKSHPSPVDFIIGKNTRVVLISGPNTGGKTVCLKTLGLAAIMAKTGLYVLCSEPAQLPWFDYVFADIGDRQSLSHSLSTFSGHLRQIGEILAESTSQSLVLLDEIGAGTNPREGTALGMSILESLSVGGALLTVATTHHGELKTLKYCHDTVENACMEFDGVNLRPTYTILWGVPGCSNAINIAERLGLLEIIVSNARKLYGTASSEIDEAVSELEKFKKDFEQDAHDARHYLMLSEGLHEKLVLDRQSLAEAHSSLRYRKMQQIFKIVSTAHSTLHKKMEEYDTFACRFSELDQPSEATQNDTTPPITNCTLQHLAECSNYLIPAEVELKTITQNLYALAW